LQNSVNRSTLLGMLKGFRDFVLRGNVVDLAVGVVIGASFGTVVSALVKDLITPFLAAIVEKPDFSFIGFTIGKTHFPVGDFLNAVVSFVIIAAAIYFFVVLPINTLIARAKRGEVAPEPSTKKCPECLSDIAIGARKCAFCTSVVA
jgi:large conductance mechanosensitive channel